MKTMKPAKAPRTAASTKRFSLVPAVAQQKMYRALAALLSKAGTESGAEVAEIAACLALDENDPLILACPARGARLVRKGGKVVGANGKRITTAMLSAIAALLGNSKATAVVCAGRLETQLDAQLEAQLESQEDYRSAFCFAARYKLPILFLVADTLAPKRRQKSALRTLYDEFGIPVFSVDANDAIAAYRVTTEALHNARQLRGPSVIEALTVNSKASPAVSPLDLLQGYMERHGNWPL